MKRRSLSHNTASSCGVEPHEQAGNTIKRLAPFGQKPEPQKRDEAKCREGEGPGEIHPKKRGCEIPGGKMLNRSC